MDYTQTIDYLFNKLPMFSHIGSAAIKKDLTNTLLLCEALGNPQNQFKTIHVAGTNGKGSTSHSLAAILQTAGYKTGLYTSPHLIDFRERIKVNGQICTQQFVIEFTQKIIPMIERIEPSFFEITVAMAFYYFAQQKVDIAIIEVGLGGRLDSTNIILPELSIITNIGLDHTSLLGNTLEEIAGEKAGIIKKNVPIVIGEYLDETRGVFIEKARELDAPIFFAQEERRVVSLENELHELEVVVENLKTNIQDSYSLDLSGVYQTKNLLTVLEAVKQLRDIGYGIENKIVKSALKNVKQLTGLHGRWELIETNPTLILDVGHNEDGIRQVVAQLEVCKYEKLHIVIGMAKDKAIDKVLALMPVEATYYFTKAQIPRALSESDLQKLAVHYHLKGESFATVADAVNAAKSNASTKDLILICGSVFVVGEFLATKKG